MLLDGEKLGRLIEDKCELINYGIGFPRYAQLDLEGEQEIKIPGFEIKYRDKYGKHITVIRQEKANDSAIDCYKQDMAIVKSLIPCIEGYFSLPFSIYGLVRFLKVKYDVIDSKDFDLNNHISLTISGKHNFNIPGFKEEVIDMGGNTHTRLQSDVDYTNIDECMAYLYGLVEVLLRDVKIEPNGDLAIR